MSAEIDSAISHLQRTTSTYPSMVKKYGPDPAKWPATSQWYMAMADLAAARKAASPQLKASFSFKES